MPEIASELTSDGETGKQVPFHCLSRSQGNPSMHSHITRGMPWAHFKEAKPNSRMIFTNFNN